eukprot:GHVL01001098.1.p1 GENE.GHVL01001098.1~~GHVL01001098.1.p1  ORF type:complete len:199 (+),score=49.64 GHVL01001098.1:1049-1645(+)
MIQRIQKYMKKTVTTVIINKIDLLENHQITYEEKWKMLFPEANILKVSAKNKTGLISLLEILKNNLPSGPPWMPKDALTDKSSRFTAEDTIREKIFELYRCEIPYECEVVVTSFKEEPPHLDIKADILVSASSKQKIIVGKGGAAIATLRKKSETALLEIFDFNKISLHLSVRVEDWRDNTILLNKYGYNPRANKHVW